MSISTLESTQSQRMLERSYADDLGEAQDRIVDATHRMIDAENLAAPCDYLPDRAAYGRDDRRPMMLWEALWDGMDSRSGIAPAEMLSLLIDAAKGHDVHAQAERVLARLVRGVAEIYAEVDDVPRFLREAA